MTPPLKLRTFQTHEKSEKMLHNHRKIRSIAQNWSQDVFLSALDDFSQTKIFSNFLKKFWQIFDFLTTFSAKFDFWTIFFWKNRKNFFCCNNQL